MSRPKGLRVIAGSARGRKLAAPPGDRVRPTKDMVREAMFSALDARGALVDATALDLYAGTGALGIEALSRGATRAVFVERDRAALDAISTNVAALRLGDHVRVVADDVDPPYDTTDEDVTALLEALDAPGWLAPDAIVSVERPARHPVVVPHGWRTGWERAFGDTLLTFCSR